MAAWRRVRARPCNGASWECSHGQVLPLSACQHAGAPLLEARPAKVGCQDVFTPSCERCAQFRQACAWHDHGWPIFNSHAGQSVLVSARLCRHGWRSTVWRHGRTSPQTGGNDQLAYLWELWLQSLELVGEANGAHQR